jgi:hypothetical protein
MWKTLSFFIVLPFIFIGGVALGSSGPGTRMIKEIVGPDQVLKWMNGLPVIISEKLQSMAIRPETLFTELDAPLKFNLGIVNPTEKQMRFSIKDMRAYSGDAELEILEPEKIIDEARKEFSDGDYKLSQEERKALVPYVEEKMRMLRDSLLKSETIPPGGRVSGLIAIRVPLGTDRLTFEVTAHGEFHIFNFQVIELK